jgi:EAL domain-containing protein (putative c-di-GMP-specific phosphodiesterase class I)
LARVGSDQFAALLPRVRPSGNLVKLMDHVVASFSEHAFVVNDVTLRLAIKFGVALYPDDGTDADTLFKNAEAALKSAKQTANRYLFYNQRMTANVAAHLSLENQLRRAYEQEQFVLHYQPKLNLATGRLVGAEALIRWNDPLTGLVAPGRFIPVLEQTGLIHEVGRWALKKAMQDYLGWLSSGLPAPRVAVNVSALQLRDRGFIAEISKTISVHPNAPFGLELEITESLVMEDVKQSIAILQAVRDIGVTVAIDDFGTGFSSLSYLSKLPVDTLKIDQSFIAEMTVTTAGSALVGTIITLAHAMNLQVVAEGVETVEQERALRLLKCDEVQGYFYSKAVPRDEFERMFLVAPMAASVD